MNQELKDAVLALTRHIHDNQFAGIILSGSTNEVSESLITTAWGTLYPNESLLPVYSFDSEANYILYKGELTLDETTTKAEQLIHQKFPELEANKQGKFCYVDELIHTGRKYHLLKQAFQALGFSDIRFAFFTTKEGSEWDPEIYVASKNNELAGEFLRLSIEKHGYPASPQDIENAAPNHKELWRQHGRDHLSELNKGIKSN